MAWWVIEGVFLHSPNNGVLGMSRVFTPRHVQTAVDLNWVLLGNLLLKHRVVVFRYTARQHGHCRKGV